MPKPKNATSRKTDKKSAKCSLPTLSIELQQSMLNVFRDSFSDCTDPAWSKLIQEVKGHLFNGNFGKAFGRPELLEAYATRWSPSRALAYLDILVNTPPLASYIAKFIIPAVKHEENISSASGKTSQSFSDSHSGSSFSNNELDPEIEAGTTGCKSIVCIGAGSGAEIVAFAGYLRHMCALSCEDTSLANSSPVSFNAVHVEEVPKHPLSIKMLDIADWSSVVERLYSRATATSILSKYASSSSAKAKYNQLTDPATLKVNFERQDVLSIEVEPLAAILHHVSLVTIMFTLNELYSTSMSKTTNLLLTLTYLMQPGSLLLVVDSPGSYSTVDLKKKASNSEPPESEKRYPMQWLLDHTLLESSNIGSSKNASSAGAQWKKAVSCESKWFRLPPGLKYPLKLEDMRYQLHLYRRI